MILNYNLIEKLTTKEAVESFIKRIEKENNAIFRAIGDNECNCGIININQNPISGAVERIVNMQDSYLERLAIENNRVLTEEDKKSPRALMGKIFKHIGGRLENLQDKIKKREIAKNMQIQLRDSSNAKRPTVDFRDFGIGMFAVEMPDTILSLNKSSKITKHYTIGTFGQGGSTAFPNSIYTIILTKKFIKGRINPEIAFTIVRYNSRLGAGFKMGVYQYLVDSKTNVPFIIYDKENKFECGTLVRHVEMDLGKYIQMVTQPSGESLWTLVHHSLFDSILPVWIEDFRINMINNSKGKSIGRTVSGNFTRLENKNVEDRENSDGKTQDILYKRSHEIKFFDERVTINYWIANFEKNKKYMRQFVNMGHPIIITLNGQKHGEMANGIIKLKANLPYLVEEMAIHINCDYLTYDLRRELFSSTRETIKNNSFIQELENLLVELLVNDDNLKHYNNLKRTFLSKGNNSGDLSEIEGRVGKKLLDSLGKNTIRNSDGKSTDEGPVGRPDGGDVVYEPIPVVEPPTMLKLTLPGKKVTGRRLVSFKIETDANPNYFKKKSGKFNVTLSDKSNFTLASNEVEIKNGRGQILIQVNDGVKVGTTCLLNLKLEHKNGVLSAQGIIKVVDKKETNPPPKVIETPKKIKIEPVVENSEYWNDKNWTKDSVGAIVFSDDQVDVYINMDNKDYAMVVKSFSKASEEIKKSIENRYIEAIVYDLLFFELRNKSAEFEIEEEKMNYLRESAYQMVGKSICSFILDNKKSYDI